MELCDTCHQAPRRKRYLSCQRCLQARWSYDPAVIAAKTYRRHAVERRAKALKKYQVQQEVAAGQARPARCEVCGNQSLRALNFDHNHESEAFRGWLCGPCNRALGCAGDNPRVLRRLAEYLDAKGCAPTRTVLR